MLFALPSAFINDISEPNTIIKEAIMVASPKKELKYNKYPISKNIIIDSIKNMICINLFLNLRFARNI